MLDTIKNKLFPPAEDDVPALADEVDALKKKLFAALVAADGRLATPEDIPYSPELLEGEALPPLSGSGWRTTRD